MSAQIIKAIVTDIEGTTSSISFVHEVLFPYAREHLAEFIRQNAQLPAVREQLTAVAEQVGKPLSDNEVIAELLDWIEQDKKHTSLKVLQGMIWQAGYESGAYQGHIYEDAYCELRAWHAANIPLYVYSSGSIKAQQLLFSHTAYGDLTPLFSGYFDTTIGGKREASAYRNILNELSLPAEQVLFLSDIVEELQAASVVGMSVMLVNRSDNMHKQDVCGGFQQITKTFF